MDDLGCLPPLDGVADEHRVVLIHILHAPGDGGAGTVVVLLIIGRAIGVVVQIVGGVGDLRGNLVEIGGVAPLSRFASSRASYRSLLCKPKSSFIPPFLLSPTKPLSLVSPGPHFVLPLKLFPVSSRKPETSAH